jgi:DNA replication protein DnaC
LRPDQQERCTRFAAWLHDACHRRDQPAAAGRAGVVVRLDAQIVSQPGVHARRAVPLQVVEILANGMKRVPRRDALHSVVRGIQMLADATAQNRSFAHTLESLADLELETRNSRAIERRFRSSRLQAQHLIDSFHFKHHKSRMELKNRILRLLDLEFLAKGTSAILIGNPGVEKTFLAKIIGWRACQANHRVLFTTAMDMLNQLSASQVDHSLVRKLKIYTEPTLLICDEFRLLGARSTDFEPLLSAHLYTPWSQGLDHYHHQHCVFRVGQHSLQHYYCDRHRRSPRGELRNLFARR